MMILIGLAGNSQMPVGLSNSHHREPKQLTECIDLFAWWGELPRWAACGTLRGWERGSTVHPRIALGTQLEKLFCFHHMATASPWIVAASTQRGLGPMALPSVAQISTPDLLKARVVSCHTGCSLQGDINTETSLLCFAGLAQAFSPR